MYVKLLPSMYLQMLHVESTTEPTARHTNHIWIYDRSASMTNLLPQLVTDMCNYVDNLLEDGEHLTLAWFSSEGVFNVMVKGVQISPESRIAIKSMIQSNADPINLTCFSEVLREVNQIVSDVKFFGESFSFLFFTDGYPVVSDYEREIVAIYNALDVISKRISHSTMLGYGQYYNRKLLSDMALRVGGNLLHADTVPNYQNHFQGHVVSSTGFNVRSVSIPDGVSHVFYIRDSGIYLCPIKDNLAFVPEDVFTIYMLTSKEGHYESTVDNPAFICAVYASAIILSRELLTGDAIDILSKLGDSYAVDLLNDAWSNSDYGFAENAIMGMINNSKLRFKNGYSKNYKSSSDRFCLLDLLDMLQQNRAKFYPYSKDFSYQRIGRKQMVQDGYPKFTPSNDNPGCSLAKLTWNNSRLNLSVSVKIDGTVKLGDEAFKYGIFPYYNTFIWRTYNIVNNGALNVYHLPVSSDYSVYIALTEKGVGVSDFSWLPSDDQNTRICYYVIDLRSIPIINKSVANINMTASEFCKLLINEYKLEAKMKVLRHYTGLLEDVFTKQADKDVQEYLEKNGIRSYGYAPPTVSEPITDYYMTREFTATAKGLSSFPKVSDVLERIKTGKQQTTAGALMQDYVKVFDGIYNQKDQRLAELMVEYTDKTIQELSELRSQIQRVKFAILLAKKWFPDLKTRDGAEIDVDGFHFTFNIKEVKEYY